MEPYRERLMGLGMVLLAAAIVDGAAGADRRRAGRGSSRSAWTVGGFGMGLIISSGGVLLLKLSAPEEAGSNSASLQISDALGNVTFVGGQRCAVRGVRRWLGRRDGPAATAGAGSASHPAAFAAVFVAMAVVALVGAGVTTRLRPERGCTGRRRRRRGAPPRSHGNHAESQGREGDCDLGPTPG